MDIIAEKNCFEGKPKAVEPTEDAKVVRRKVYDAIDAVYDQTRKCYTRGLKGFHSDETIASGFGCSSALVAKIREEFFGPDDQTEPTEEIMAIQREMAFIEKEMQDRDNLIAGLKVQMKEGHEKLKATRAKLKALCEANGWYH